MAWDMVYCYLFYIINNLRLCYNVLHRTATDIKDWNNSNTPLNRSPHRAPGDKYFNVGTRAILIVK